jgi:cobalt transporter subunit CbtB
MNVQNVATAQTTSISGFLSLIAVAALGLGVIFVAGHVQAATLHDAAHDVRHATGFPCH